jgi:hypothetical protein
MEFRERMLSRTRVLPRSSRLLRSPRRGYQHSERRVAKYFPDEQSVNMALRKLIHVTKVKKIS